MAKRWDSLVLGCAALLVVVGLAVVVAAEARTRLPRGVEVAGVAVGGVSVGEAERLVSVRAEELAGRSIVVVGPEGEVRTTGAELGAHPRVVEAVAAAGQQRFGRARDLLDGGQARRVTLS